MHVLSVIFPDFRLLMKKVRIQEMNAEKTDNVKKDIIKRSARDLFFRLGLTKTSMADIAVQSGMAKPTLYYYYANKEALFEEIVIDEAKNLLDEIEGELSETEPGAGKMVLFFEKIYQRLIIQNKLIAEIPEVMCNHMPHGRPVVDKIRESMIDIIINILNEGRMSGELKMASVEATAQAVIHMMSFMNLEWIKNTSEEVRDQMFSEVMHILMNGLRGRNGKI